MDRLARLAIFSLPHAPDKVDGLDVLRSGKLFQAGDYPDKEFSMSEAELAAAVAAFEACDIDLEHTPTVLSGKLGRLESVTLSDDGKSLHGIVRLPKWLDDQLGETECKVSATWDRVTKQLKGLALVIDPRVPDAVLMAAFAAFAAEEGRHDTRTGQSVVQRLHNVAAEAGAVCTPPSGGAKPNGSVGMASQHESEVVQQIHDLTTAHGADCAALSPQDAQYPKNTDYPMFSAPGATTAAPATTTVAKPATTATAAVAAPPAAPAATRAPKEGRSMSWKDRLLAAIQGMPEDDTETSTAAAAAAPPAPAAPAAPAGPTVVTQAAAPATMSAELTEMHRLAEAQRGRAEAAEAENRRLIQERIHDRAVAFADKAIAESRAFPSERDGLIAEYIQAATDDSLYGVVTMAEGKPTTRVALKEAAMVAREPHKLTAEQITPALMTILQGSRETPAQDAGDRKADPDEVRRLIAMTAAGEGVLKAAHRDAPSSATNGTGH
jgi:hypothetical protein